MANSADPDQLASSEANWSESTLFARQGISGFSRTRVNSLQRVDGSFTITKVSVCRDFEEPDNPEIDIVQFKQILIQAVKSLFGIVSMAVINPCPAEPGYTLPLQIV